jgi:hypothetical protein
MPSLDLNPEIVQFVIDKVHEFHSREDVTFPEEAEVEVLSSLLPISQAIPTTRSLRRRSTTSNRTSRCRWLR